MKAFKISPEDPKLTAYALGELEGDDFVAVEMALRDNPEAQAAVDQIRAMAGQLEGALASEALPPTQPPAPVSTDPYRRMQKKIIGFPQFYFVAAGLAAAGFAVMVALHEPPATPVVQQPKGEQKYYIEMPTAPMAAAVNSDEVAGKLTVIEAQKQAMESAIAAQTFKSRAREAKSSSGNTAGSVPFELGQTRLQTSQVQTEKTGQETYTYRADNGFLSAKDSPLSTFSIASDTASYTNVRRLLNAGQKPPVDAVRIEEMLNYFPYHYPAPKNDAAFAASLEVADAPWAAGHRLVRIGLKGREVTTAERGAANLVFLLDVSGSMNAPNRLPLVKESLRMLVRQLRPDDRVAIITYAGHSGMALASTPVKRATEILASLDELEASGSTNGAMGIQLAYDVAKANFVSGGINRVILCTDGDFNVGVTDPSELTRLIQDKAKSGVFLSVLGFGMGNYKDSTLESLANKGNGNYGYIDNQAEAEKVFVQQVNGTLATIAKDVKIQVEFNPAQVSRYRLIGYESRLLNQEDFNNDKVDAGKIGAGHTVTALYDVIPVGVDVAVGKGSVDPLKYQSTGAAKRDDRAEGSGSTELLTVKLRYKDPAGDESRKLEFPLVDSGERFADASEDFKFAAAVAGFGMLLRDSQDKGNLTLAEVTHWAHLGMQHESGDYRSDFLKLLERAETVIE